MPDLQALLDQIDRLDQQATPGPWVHDEHDTNPNMDSIVSTALGDLRWIEVARSINHDTEFIALARTALPQLAKALQTVIEGCEETIRSVDKNLLPNERDHAFRDHADMILDAITDAMEAE